MKLVFIHGRDQQKKDPVKLQNQWVRALKKGLKAADLKFPSKIDIHFPFYGDKLDELIKKLDTPLIDGVKFRGDGTNSDEASFRGALLSEMAEKAGITDSEIQKHYQGSSREKGVLNWGWVQAILKALDGTPLGEAAIDSFARDVFVYLTNPTVRKTIEGIVKPFLSSGPCVVVGHSLGSVVGYNLLSQTKAVVKKYVTVGSPLAIKAIKQKLVLPLSMPISTQAWFNALDRRDGVALYPLDSEHFKIKPPIKNKTDVNNTTANRHGIKGYLDDPVVAREIYKVLV